MSVSLVGFRPALWNKSGLNSPLLHYQSSPEELVQQTLQREEGELSDSGALVIRTGTFTGRSPRDKFIVRDELSTQTVCWNEFNIPISEAHYQLISRDMHTYLDRLPEIWVRDCYACAEENYQLAVRVISEKPWADLFTHNMFLRPAVGSLEHFVPGWTILFAPEFQLRPEIHGTRQSNAAVISFKHRTILIAGTGYTGEIKKSLFTVLNYILPVHHNILSMHCSANRGIDGRTALFFGLSGTGKTTLSADPGRQLIGDDEHGWSANGIFNFEGGCYAKCIDLNEENEPEIFGAIRSGALVENTGFEPGTNRINFANRTITENTRVSYPIYYIGNARPVSKGEIPSHIFFLTCDAYGVLPPISKLSRAQAMYQFISGYTAKVAGTETGVSEPKATFSTCFAAPFLPLHPGKYASMLGERLRRHQVQVWLINTGWTGGPYGTGERIRLNWTRAMVEAALNGELNKVPYEVHPIFGFNMPKHCTGVPDEVLNPRNTWENPEEYDTRVRELAEKFTEHFQKYASGVTEEVLAAGPRPI